MSDNDHTFAESDNTVRCPRCGGLAFDTHSCEICEEEVGEDCMVQVAPGQWACKEECAAAWEAEGEANAERQAEHDLNPDNGPSDATYRRDMREAGRGHLL